MGSIRVTGTMVWIGLALAACSATPAPTVLPGTIATASPATATGAASSPTTTIPVPSVPSGPSSYDSPTLDTPSPSAPDSLPTPEPTFPAAVKLGDIAAVCDIEQNPYANWHNMAPCQYMANVLLANIGAGAVNVTRIHASFTAMNECGCYALVGFKDGRLEAFDVDWLAAEVSDGRPVSASAWPWGAASSFASPAVARPKLALAAPTALANRTPLPYCGDDRPGETADHFPCFVDSVLAGKPAEYISEAPGYEGGWFVMVYRFTGSGAVTVDAGGDYVHNNETKTRLSWEPRHYGMIERYSDGSRGIATLL